MLRVINCVADFVSLAIPQAIEWQRIGNQIDGATIFARAHFVNAVLLLVPLKSFEVRVQRTLSNLIDEIGNTGRGGKLSIISFVERKLNPNNDGLHQNRNALF
jgi:hypothetical protein